MQSRSGRETVWFDDIARDIVTIIIMIIIMQLVPWKCRKLSWNGSHPGLVIHPALIAVQLDYLRYPPAANLLQKGDDGGFEICYSIARCDDPQFAKPLGQVIVYGLVIVAAESPEYINLASELWQLTRYVRIKYRWRSKAVEPRRMNCA